MVVAPARRPLHRPGHAPPALIAHGGGNGLGHAESALLAAADFLEVDLWVHNGRFEARHERRLPFRIPVFYEKWYLRFAPRSPFGLEELITAATGGTGILLDLKNGGATAAALVRRALDAAEAPVRIVASSQFWVILRALAERVPEAELLYSIDVQAKLDLFLAVSERDRRAAGVSCRHGLLSRAVVEELHARGLNVVAWTVDDVDRAEQLAEWGVDGITTHRVEDIRARLGGVAP